MPQVSVQRGYFSDVFTGINTHENSNAMQYNFASITPAIAGLVTSPIGVPLIYNATNTAWEVVSDTNIGELGSESPDLPNGGGVAISAGSALGAGISDTDVDFETEDVTVMYRGANNAGVMKDGIDYSNATISTANQAAFEAALEKAGIMVVEAADQITPSYIG